MPLPAGVLNGRIPLVFLSRLGWDEADHLYLEADAARSLNDLAKWFELEFGQPLLITDAYRPYDVQVRLKVQKGPFAATPGKSEHGWAKAVDMASRINVDSSREHRWMEQHGPRFGWVNPPWATDRDPKNGQYEPWHWEYDSRLDTHPGPPPEDEMSKEDVQAIRDELAAIRSRVENIDRQMTGADQQDPSAVSHLQGIQRQLQTVLDTLRADVAAIPGKVWSQDVTHDWGDGPSTAPATAWLGTMSVRVRDLWNRLGTGG